jgi:putrescine importer
MGVNLSVFWHFTILNRKERRPRIFIDAVLPLLGFAFCGLIWLNLNIIAKIAGGIWFAIGLSYLCITTRGFTRGPKTIDFTES